MSTSVIVYVLTALAAVVVVLTQLRLGSGGRAAGRLEIPARLVAVHTWVGGVALVLWVGFLLAGDGLGEGTATLVGLAALACWWATVVAGLLILMRWLPTHGKHAADGVADTWSDGPALSILAHVGLLVGVVVFTYAYLFSAV